MLEYAPFSEGKRYLVNNNTFFCNMIVKEDGTVMATGSNAFGQCDVEEWTNIVDIAAGNTATTAITADGKVLLAGILPNDIFAAEEWPAVSLEDTSLK